MLRRPAFVRPSRSRLQDDPAVTGHWPLLPHLLRNRGPRWQPAKIPVHGHLQHMKHLEVPGGGMGLLSQTRNANIIKTGCPLAGIVQANSKSAIGEPPENRAASQRLKIDHPIE